MSANEPVSILLVDDLNENLLVLKSILEGLGERLVTATSGAEALQLVLHHDFAVILLDVNMPGIDGMEAAELIRKRKKSAHTPIIFMTAYADELHTARGYALGAVDCILSPVIPDVLRTKVKVFVDLYRMSRVVQRQAEERVALAEEQARRAAAEETSRQYTFLADAGSRLARTLDYDATCRTLAEILLPALGDWLAITPFYENAGFVGSHLYEMRRPAANHPAAIVRVEKDNFAHWPHILPAIHSVLEFDEEKVVAPVQHDHASTTSYFIPLRVQGKYMGVMALGRNAERRTFTAADQHLLREIAGRAAVALDNARLYSALQRADREKNEFLSMLAHELRNPLASICSAVQLLQTTAYDGHDIEWVRDVVSRQMTQLVRLVDDLLDVSRITQGKIQMRMSLVHPAEFLHRAIEMSQPLIHARQQQLDIDIPHDFPKIQGDLVRLTQVVSNLLNNAAKYTPEGGNIHLSAHCDNGELKIRVRDNGIGISANMLARVFDLFTQDSRALDRAQGGLGIGLTLVRRLTEMHGGTVLAYSEGEQRGSEFIVCLPLANVDANAESWHIEPELPTATAVPRNILIVDDNVDAAIGLSRLLRTFNYQVRMAHDGHAALQLFSESKPDAVLLDIGLPGMDGYEVAGHIRQISLGKPPLLIAITGYGQDEDQQRSQQAGFNFHLVKPVKMDMLLAALDSLNEAHPTPSSQLTIA